MNLFYLYIYNAFSLHSCKLFVFCHWSYFTNFTLYIALMFFHFIQTVDSALQIRNGEEDKNFITSFVAKSISYCFPFVLFLSSIIVIFSIGCVHVMSQRPQERKLGLTLRWWAAENSVETRQKVPLFGWLWNHYPRKTKTVTKFNVSCKSVFINVVNFWTIERT